MIHDVLIFGDEDCFDEPLLQVAPKKLVCEQSQMYLDTINDITIIVIVIIVIVIVCIVCGQCVD